MTELEFNPTRLKEIAVAYGYIKPRVSVNDEPEVDQARLAKLMNVSVSMVWRMLNDKRNPGGKAMLGLRNAFPHVQPEYFFAPVVTDRES